VNAFRIKGVWEVRGNKSRMGSNLTVTRTKEGVSVVRENQRGEDNISTREIRSVAAHEKKECE